jgi:uncharacterized membrane protein HdeD (DUF308 family)
MANEKQSWQKQWKQHISFWLSLYRGGVAVILGVVLIFYPTKTQTLLVNLLGFFWLSSGFVLLRDKTIGRRTSLILGPVAVLSGLLVVGRSFIRYWIEEGVVISLLGLIILFTGVLHMVSSVRIGSLNKRQHSRTISHFLLGAFECFIGLLLFVSPLERSPVIYFLATAWSLIFGFLVIGSALNERN